MLQGLGRWGVWEGWRRSKFTWAICHQASSFTLSSSHSSFPVVLSYSFLSPHLTHNTYSFTLLFSSLRSLSILPFLSFSLSFCPSRQPNSLAPAWLRWLPRWGPGPMRKRKSSIVGIWGPVNTWPQVGRVRRRGGWAKGQMGKAYVCAGATVWQVHSTRRRGGEGE